MSGFTDIRRKVNDFKDRENRKILQRQKMECQQGNKEWVVTDTSTDISEARSVREQLSKD